MNEVGPPRPPLSRAAPVLAVGLALVLAGGFAVGIFVGRNPPPDSASGADQVLPPATSLPATVPVQPPPAPPPPPPPSPPPVVTPPPLPAAPPPAPVVAKPPPAPVPAIVPAHKPESIRKPAPTAHAKRPPERDAVSRPHKPEAAHGLPRPVEGGSWVVQLGAFQSDDHAKLLVDSLAYHGHAARIAGGHGRDGHDWYFVQTPGYATRGEAEKVARVLRRSEHLPTYVFETHRPPGG
jgi:septal ring-binding cell division protein DamX